MNNLKVWFSIASSTGLSVVSLGTPGLKEDLDEQVFAGGISAVSHLLSTEIGSADKSFIGGGDTRKMGRFIIDPKNNSKEIITQFLLMSTDDSKIPETILSYIQEIAITFSNIIVLSPLCDEVETSFKTLSSLDVYEIFLDAIISARKKFKIQLNDSLIDEKLNYLIDYTTKSPEFFDTLNEFSNQEPTIDDLKKLKASQKTFFENLFKEILSIILDDDPIPVIFKNKPKEILSDIERMFSNHFDKIKDNLIKDQLLNNTAEIFSGEIADLLDSFSVLEMREVKARIQVSLANEVIKRISKKNPIVILLNPELNSSLGSFNKFIEEKVEEIYQEYDLASILGKITSILLEDENPISQFLISEFVRLFAMQYPGGLSEYAWKYIQNLFQLFSRTKKYNIKDALAKLEISDSRLETINSYLKGIKPNTDLRGLKFVVENEGDELIKFYNTLQQVIIQGSQIFFDEIVWQPKQLGIFSQIYVEKIEEVVSQTQYLTSYLSMLKYMYSQIWEFITTKNYIPAKEDFISILPSDEADKIDPKNIPDKILSTFWKPKNIAKCFENHTLKSVLLEIENFNLKSDSIKTSVKEELTNFESYCTKILNDTKIGKFTHNLKNNTNPSENIEYSSLLESSFKEITKAHTEFNEKIDKCLQDLSSLIQLPLEQRKSRENERLLSRVLEDLKKLEERLMRRIEDSQKRITDYNQKTIKNIERETQKAQKDLQKIFQTSIVQEYAVKESRSREEFNIQDPKHVCSNIIDAIEISTDNEPFKFPKYNELVAVLASIVIFNQLPKNVFSDIINQAILQGNRASPILTELITEIRHNDSMHAEDFLRKNVRHEVERKIKFLFESILNKVNSAYFKGIVKLFPINSPEFGEISCVDVGDLNIPWVIENFTKELPDSLGSKLHFVKIDDKYHLFYEIEKFPSSGQRFPITKAIIQGTWNEIIGDQTGLFIEILKMSCEMIGESKRRRFQEFLEKLFQIMD